MESKQNFEWKARSQDAEQPDEHGLCWRETHIGTLAFKTNEDGSVAWFQFDSNGEGRQVGFDETGQAFYVDGDHPIPVPIPNTDQLPQPESQQHSEFHKSESRSQETFGWGTTASQIEMITDSRAENETHTSSEFNNSAGGSVVLPDGVCIAISEKDKPEPENMVNQKIETEPLAHRQPSRNVCESGFFDTLSHKSIEAHGHATAKTAKRRPFTGSAIALQSQAGGIGELLSLWEKSNAPQDKEKLEHANTQQWPIRLQQVGIAERLEKVVDDEKAFAAAFENQITILSIELERMQSTVTLAEQRLEQCYETHRKIAELQTSILTSWSLANVMQNVAKRAESFLHSSSEK